jgi:hypothetical protein
MSEMSHFRPALLSTLPQTMLGHSKKNRSTHHDHLASADADRPSSADRDAVVAKRSALNSFAIIATCTCAMIAIVGLILPRQCLNVVTKFPLILLHL